jgi:hypothetical protein
MVFGISLFTYVDEKTKLSIRPVEDTVGEFRKKASFMENIE